MTGKRRRETGADTSCGGVGRTAGSDGVSILFPKVNYQYIVVYRVYLTIFVDVRSGEPKLARLTEIGEKDVVVKNVYFAVSVEVAGAKYSSWSGGRGGRRGGRSCLGTVWSKIRAGFVSINPFFIFV